MQSASLHVWRSFKYVRLGRVVLYVHLSHSACVILWCLWLTNSMTSHFMWRRLKVSSMRKKLVEKPVDRMYSVCNNKMLLNSDKKFSSCYMRTDRQIGTEKLTGSFLQLLVIVIPKNQANRPHVLTGMFIVFFSRNMTKSNKTSSFYMKKCSSTGTEHPYSTIRILID